MNIIETEGLTRRFGRARAVDELTFHVPEGAIYAFLGPNGAGKTTTILTLLNILHPTSGVARVLGVDTRHFGPAQFARIGYVSENQKLPEAMTVARFLAWCKPMYPMCGTTPFARIYCGALNSRSTASCGTCPGA
jgi:ABC-2 type transport system ATP-binding protein